jgi:hypothetical protein
MSQGLRVGASCGAESTVSLLAERSDMVFLLEGVTRRARPLTDFVNRCRAQHPVVRVILQKGFR